MRSLTLTISFAHSPSTGLDDALALARQNRSFMVVGDDQGPTYRVSYDQNALDQYHQLWSMVGHWRGSEHRLNGLVVKYDLSREMIQCCQECLQSPDGASYCRGGDLHQTQVGTVAPLFPCRMIPIAETNHLGWFQYGQFNRDKIFLVDKIKLRQRVNHYLEKSLASHCPMLNEEAIDQVIHKLPTRINPQEDSNWVYRQGWVKGRYQIIGVEKRQVGAGRSAAQNPERPAAAENKKPTALAKNPAGDVAADGDDKQRDIPTVNYQDIGGLDAVIARVRESIELPLKMPQIFARLGIAPHRGVLLYGPPGTGKTLIAKALATECKAHFILVNGPEVISKWHGDTEANLRKIFEEARAKAPTVILFDEIDSIAPVRDNVTHNFEAVAVSQLLSLMDGLVDRGQVVVVGTTNRPQSVDPALKRPGRLELQLEIGLPDEQGRRTIIGIHSQQMPLNPDVDLDELAANSDGFSGADLAALCREAGMYCLREQLILGLGEIPTLSDEQIAALTVRMEHFTMALEELQSRRGEDEKTKSR